MPTYSVTVDTARDDLVLRTSNKKYFKRWHVPALRRAGVERLARVFASHGDLDHADGLVPVLMELPVGELWVASRKRPTATLRAVLEAAERRAVPVHAADEEPGLGDLDAVLEASLLQPWPGDIRH